MGRLGNADCTGDFKHSIPIPIDRYFTKVIYSGVSEKRIAYNGLNLKLNYLRTLFCQKFLQKAASSYSIITHLAIPMLILPENKNIHDNSDIIHKCYICLFPCI